MVTLHSINGHRECENNWYFPLFNKIRLYKNTIDSIQYTYIAVFKILLHFMGHAYLSHIKKFFGQ